MSALFGTLDYCIVITMLLLSTIIGLYFAWKDRKNTNEDEFLRGGKNMGTIPVCISLIASFLPSTQIIGFPIIIYTTGTMVSTVLLPAAAATIFACELFIPIYYKMNLISVNQYLNRRYKSEGLQIAANISNLFSYIPFFAVEMFSPAIALSIVMDLSINSSILIIALVVTVYTSLGGLKGVIWTDFFQFGVIMIGFVAVIVRGATVSGGMANAFRKAYEGGRIEFWNMDFDIYSMNSFWVMLFGFTILWTGTFSTSQLSVQRSVCMPTLRAAKRALYMALPGFMIIITMTIVLGVVLYARYFDCDPLLTGRVTRADQLVPYFVLDIFEHSYKGMAGVFVSCIFASSLSTLSSGLNAMATIIWDDYGKKVLKWVPDSYSVYITKGLAAAIGLLSLCISFGIKESKNIVDVVISLYGASVGPLLAVFCMGLFAPWCNKWGAGVSLITGQMLGLWITIGAVASKRDPTTMMLGLSTDACAAKNITVNMPGMSLADLKNYKIPQYYPTGFDVIHHISPYFVPVIGFVWALVLGNLISLLTKGNVGTKLDKNLIHFNVSRFFEKILPQSWQQLQDESPPDETPVPPMSEFSIRNDSKMDVFTDNKLNADWNHNEEAFPLKQRVDRMTKL